MEGNVAFILVCSALVLLMTPGLAFFYGGMVRRKNVLNTLMSCFFICGLGSVLWVAVGYTLAFGGNHAGIVGDFSKAFFQNVSLESADGTAIPEALFAAFQMMFAIITPALIVGSLEGRMKFPAMVIFIALWSLLVYYPMAHMVWHADGILGTGWLESVDFAGGNVVHISSGVSGLVACILLGKRKGYGVVTYKPHNIPYVVLGAALLWFGWFGFNAGSALSSGSLAIHAFITTNTSAAAALLSWMLVEKMIHGKPTTLGAATGAVVGLVAITPGAGFVPIWASMIIGALVSPICYFFMTKVKGKFGYDDALDVFGCHGIGGIWGGIATGLFCKKSINSLVVSDGLVFGEVGQFWRQLVAIAITIAFAAIVTAIIVSVMKLFGKIRVSDEDEAIGLDQSEHNESAYPSFMGLD